MGSQWRSGDLISTQSAPALLRKVGAVAAICAGTLGIVALLSVLPYPDLYGPDARPSSTLSIHPGVRMIWVTHYLVLLAGAVIAFPAAYVLYRALRQGGPTIAFLAFLLMVAGLVAFAYGSTLRSLMVTRSLYILISGGGTAFLGGVFLFSVMMWRRSTFPRWIAGLGILGTAAQFALAYFVFFGPLPPLIWGITLPPPGDWLVAIWFVFVGFHLWKSA